MADPENKILVIKVILSFQVKPIGPGLKYLGFILEPCSYKITGLVMATGKDQKKDQNLE